MAKIIWKFFNRLSIFSPIRKIAISHWHFAWYISIFMSSYRLFLRYWRWNLVVANWTSSIDIIQLSLDTLVKVKHVKPPSIKVLFLFSTFWLYEQRNMHYISWDRWLKIIIFWSMFLTKYFFSSFSWPVPLVFPFSSTKS